MGASSELLKIGIMIIVSFVGLAALISGNYFHMKKVKDQDFQFMYQMYEELKKKEVDKNKSNYTDDKIEK